MLKKGSLKLKAESRSNSTNTTHPMNPKNPTKLICHTVIFLLASVLFFAGANAYVLHGSHLLELMTKEIGQADSLRVYQKLIVHESEPDGEAFELTETLMFVFPEAFRSEISSQNAERIHVVAGRSTVTIIDGKVVADYETEFDRYKDIFLYNTRPLLERRLPQLGVDPSISSVGRFQDRIGFILGAQYPDESVPQLWLDKDTFRPFRWILKPGSDDSLVGALEVRYYGWRKVDSIWYPVRIEFYQGDTILRTIQVQKLQANPKLSGELFDIRRLKSKYPKGGPLLPRQPESEKQGEVQKTLERFHQIFE